MKNPFLLALILCVFAFGHVHAQSVNDEIEIQAFTRSFMSAYNQQDEAALQQMYLEDAVRVDAGGHEISGARQIGAYFAKQFIEKNTTLLLRPSSISWSDQQHAFVARGTYEIYGNTHVYDIQIHDTGAYANSLIKVNGEWKIARSVLTPMIKVMVYHKVADFAEWRWAFENGKAMRQAAGELHSETGRLHDDPTTAYFIGEWNSLESFQSYLADPEVGKSMKEAGVLGKPTIMILDKPQ